VWYAAAVRLRLRLRLGQFGILFGAGVAGISVAQTTGLGLVTILPATLVALWGIRAWGRRAVGAESERLMRAIAAERTGEALEHVASLKEAYADYPSMLAQLGVNEAALLTSVGRNGDALRVLEAIDREKLAAAWRPWHANNLAFCLAEEGQAERGLTLVRESIALSERAASLGEKILGHDALEASQLGTLGACLVKTGAYEEAREALERSLGLGGAPGLRAGRAYYLGEALRPLGRLDEAKAAFDQALREAPESPWAKRARSALDALADHR
jgi:tetratricopeptide (TPR) repeat protein